MPSHQSKLAATGQLHAEAAGRLQDREPVHARPQRPGHVDHGLLIGAVARQHPEHQVGDEGAGLDIGAVLGRGSDLYRIRWWGAATVPASSLILLIAAMAGINNSRVTTS